MHAIDVGARLAAVVLLAVLGRAVFAYFWPYRPCRWCRPGALLGGSVAARLAGHKPERRKQGRCWRCKGTRLTRRLGAFHAHKVRDSLGQARDEQGWRL